MPSNITCQLLYAADLVLMSETIDGLRNTFIKWKRAFESKGFKVNHLEKGKVMVIGEVVADGWSNSKDHPHWVFNLRLMKANSVLCV